MKRTYQPFEGRHSMKRAVLLAALALAALLCACGEGEVPPPAESSPPPSVEMPPTPPPEGPGAEPPNGVSPAPERSSEVWKDPVLHYRAIRSHYWSDIRRSTLDPQGYCLSVFIEVPVFKEEGEGYQKINRFFDDLERQFFTPENEALIRAWETVTYPDGPEVTEEYPFFYERNVWINSQTDKLVSVTLDSDWMMGGVHDVRTDSYTFRTDTGELVKLTDLVDESEEEVREIIFAALEERNSQEEYGVGAIELDYLRDYTLDDFEFCIVDDQIVIRFDRYEASYGAYGNFAITLPIEVNPKF